MDLGAIEAAIKPDDIHYARTRLIALENTFGGRALPMHFMNAVADIARRHKLGLHLDGARAFNAAKALGIGIDELAAPFDTVSTCLSKGLGAPVGSVLSGPTELIEKARRNRKMLGGGMRQAGILAAAGLYALEHNIDRLVEDHQRALRLAEGLARHDALRVIKPDTNIVWVEMEPGLSVQLAEWLAANGVAIGAYYAEMRWVTHLDVNDDDVTEALRLTDQFFTQV